MLGRIFAAPISDFLSLDFSIFCVLAGVDELNLYSRSRGIGTEDFCLLVRVCEQRFFAGLYFCISKIYRKWLCTDYKNSLKYA